jgi:PST family polysaccharide transporter
MATSYDPQRGEVAAPGSGESDSESLSSRVRKGAFWVVASNLVLRLANVLLTAVVAHILSPQDFGDFAVALTAYAIISSIGELGVTSILIRADLDIDRLAPTVTTISVLSTAVFADAMAAMARPVATALGSAAAVGPIKVLSLAVLLLGVFAVPTAQMARNFKQDKIFLANAIGFVPSTILLIVLAKAGSGAMAFAWSMVVRQLVVGCVLLVAAPRYYRPGLDRSALSVIMSFGMPLAVANFVNFSLLNVDYAFVGHLLGAAALGTYMLAFTVASWPSALLGGVINSISLPAFSRVKHDPSLLINATAASVRAVSLIVMPICAMMIALAHPLVLTLYGQKWAAVANVLPVLALYSAVFMLCLLFANMLTSFGRTKVLLALQLLWICTLVPGMVIGVHRVGIIGAAYAHVAVILPIVLPSYLLVLKRVTGVGLTVLARAAILAVLASSLAAVAAHAAASQFSSPLVQLVAGLATGGLVYVICAGRQGAAVFGRGRSAERVLAAYSAAARAFGLPADGRAKHAAGFRASGRGRVTDGVSDTGPTQKSFLSGQARAFTTSRVEDIALGANVSQAYWQMDWPAKAVGLHERDLTDKEGQLGPDHPHTLASRVNLAHAYRQAGLLAKAIPAYERTLADLTRLLGSDHPRTLRCGNYLAAAYCDAGRVADAVPLYEQGLDGRLRLLGPDHPSTSRSRTYLAKAYVDAGRPADAIPLYEETVASQRQLLGIDHPSTLHSEINLAQAYLDADRATEAVALCAKTLAHSSRVLGNNHELTRVVRRQLSYTESACRNRLLGVNGQGEQAPDDPKVATVRDRSRAMRHSWPSVTATAGETGSRLIGASGTSWPDHSPGNGTSSASTSADVGADDLQE